MPLTPNNKIKISRIKDIPALVNNTDKFIISENNEIKYINKDSFKYILNSSNIVNGFKILSMNGSTITFSSGSVISPIINGKQYILKFNGGTLDTNISINEGGTADKISTKMWKQPILTSNTSSEFMTVSASDSYDNNYLPWKAFNGTNSSRTDCWHTLSNSIFPKWIQANLKYPIEVDKFAIQNRNDGTAIVTIGLVFKIFGLNENDVWEELVNIDDITAKVLNVTSNGWNEYTPLYTNKVYKAFKYECYRSYESVAISIGRFEIIGHYKGYRLPDTYYNVFVIGKENEENPDAKIITTTEETPIMPEGYTYGVKLGFYKTDNNYNTTYFYPKMNLNEAYNHGFVITESLTNPGYRIYSDGWKVQWGTNANPVFPIAFDNIPVSVERGATNVTKTGMTLGARYWNVEGY